VPEGYKAWLRDPLLGKLYRAVRSAGPLRSISVDLTHVCNLRCAGCYFFAEDMDQRAASVDPRDLDEFVAREQERGTNFVTIVGGEPSLALDKLKTLYDSFKLSVATNGTRRIPTDGFEQLPIGVSVWGDHETDRALRGGGQRDVFAQALRNYRGDDRAFFYYTLAAGHTDAAAEVVEECVQNGNRVLFNFYGDLEQLGGELDHDLGFEGAREAVDRAIERYPDRILLTSRLAEVISTGTLFDERWGHATCTSISPDHAANQERILNGHPFNPHFRAYNADLETTRRCCTGVDRDCSSCFDTWEHFSWVMLNMRKHLGSKRHFTEWLTTMYLFYFINRLVDVDEGARMLPEIHRRTHRRAAAQLVTR